MQQIKDYEKLFDAVLNASHDGILILDNKGIVIYVNKAISAFISCNPSDVLGQHFNTLIEKHIFSKRSISMKALQEKRKVTTLLEVRGKKMLTTATPYVNDQNEVEFVISNVRNLGELETIASMFLENQGKWYSPNLNRQDGLLRKKVIKDKIKELGFLDFNFESDAMTEICEIALKIAPLDIPVLIMGDSGVGKGLLAQIIHKASFRSDRTMIEINCASIPESLIDSELFGYTEGTFTGGRKMGKTGLIEAAHKSTILLDEISAMPLEFQTRLLKFLDDGYILPLGSRERKWIDVRVIAATNFDLSEQIAKGRFRKDLFYRLSVLPINIPPLCNRKEDINILIETFLENYRKKYRKSININQDARRYLLYHDCPGNVRELKNILERLSILAKNDIIGVDDLPPYLIQNNIPSNIPVDMFISYTPLKKMVANYEIQVINRLMDTYKSTYKVAELLGVSQPTIVRKMHLYKHTVNVKTKEHKEG